MTTNYCLDIVKKMKNQAIIFIQTKYICMVKNFNKTTLGSQVGLRRKTVIYYYDILRSGVRLAPGRYFFDI